MFGGLVIALTNKIYLDKTRLNEYTVGCLFTKKGKAVLCV